LRTEKDFFFLGERRGNVYENKGPESKARGGSGNVYENKGTYLHIAGMYLKTQDLQSKFFQPNRKSKVKYR
jgi:hypothetical protein